MSDIDHDDIRQRLDALISDGLTISHCIAAFSERQTPRQRVMIEAAKTEDGVIEVDMGSGSVCSGDDDELDEGTYVLAWLWVDNPNFDPKEKNE